VNVAARLSRRKENPELLALAGMHGREPVRV
jgi:hypothetical protein